MMQIGSIHKAKTHLSDLVKRAESGEEIIICKAGKPVVRLVKYDLSSVPRQAGLWKGKVKMASDFDQLPPTLRSAFLGDEV